MNIVHVHLSVDQRIMDLKICSTVFLMVALLLGLIDEPVQISLSKTTVLS